MLRRIVGLLLIFSSLFFGYRLQLQQSKTHQTSETLPLCQSLNSQIQGDASLEKYWGHVNGVSLLSQLNDPGTENLFKKCLVSLFKPVPTLNSEGFLVEVDLFDTKEKLNHNDNTRAWKGQQTLEAAMNSQIVLQISVLDAKTKNKVAESGAMIDFETLEKSQKKTQ